MGHENLARSFRERQNSSIDTAKHIPRFEPRVWIFCRRDFLNVDGGRLALPRPLARGILQQIAGDPRQVGARFVKGGLRVCRAAQKTRKYALDEILNHVGLPGPAAKQTAETRGLFAIKRRDVGRFRLCDTRMKFIIGRICRTPEVQLHCAQPVSRLPSPS
ncbi:hypothetical protein GGQ98_003069 [Sphingosinicella soli]|uniref:Uncharacterized protein n=1 Tax=Sphingosinicella soli TaxID=333708 RepID=A0A7W7B3P6_9SPHN|nr:hypothetical protein [Sphingosinicella soli]